VSVFAAAVRDRLIASSPCVDVRLPRGERAKAVSQFLTTEPVHAQAGAISARYRALIVAGAGTGLRPGELFGLTAPRVDFLRRQVHVEEQLVRVRGAGVELGPLKTESSYRTAPLPSVVADALAAHMAAFGSHPDLGLIFTNERGGPIQQQPFAAAFETARKKAGLPEWATPHDLRHYFASLLIRSGSSVKVVQKRLGHASAMTTLDTYVHLWPDEEDRTRDAVDDELRTPVGGRVTAARVATRQR
jgi:integrase